MGWLTTVWGQTPTTYSSSAKAIALIGYCSAGTANQVYQFSSQSIDTVVALLGYGPLSEWVAQILSLKGHCTVLAVPVDTVDSVGGVAGSVTATGTTPPTLTVTNVTANKVNGDYSFVITPVVVGAVGTATVKISIDGGITYLNNGNPFTTNTVAFAIANTGVKLAWAAGTVAADNKWIFSTVAVQPAAGSSTTTGLYSALQALANSPWQFNNVWMIYEDVTAPFAGSDATRATALSTSLTTIDTYVQSLQAASTPRFFEVHWTASRPVATTTAGLTTWGNALLANATLGPAGSYKEHTVSAGHWTYSMPSKVEPSGSMLYASVALSAAMRYACNAPGESLAQTANTSQDGLHGGAIPGINYGLATAQPPLSIVDYNDALLGLLSGRFFTVQSQPYAQGTYGFSINNNKAVPTLGAVGTVYSTFTNIDGAHYAATYLAAWLWQKLQLRLVVTGPAPTDFIESGEAKSLGTEAATQVWNASKGYLQAAGVTIDTQTSVNSGGIVAQLALLFFGYASAATMKITVGGVALPQGGN